MKKLYHFSRLFLGIVFIFSGFVKAVDPMGTAIKFSDYFNYAFHLPQLTVLSLPLSLLMCAVELLVGILLFVNVLPRLTNFIAIFLMLVFTPLTFYLAIENPVSDCGCFGDAVKLSNWQTFWKNIVIDFFLIFIFIKHRKYPPKLKLKYQQMIAVSAILLSVGFELFNYSFLPMIDFRPYKVGSSIPELMKVPEDAPKDEFKISFVYKNSKTNEVREFSEENYPWDDSTWVWQETKSKLIKKGYTPPIHDFELIDLYENNITETVLSRKDTTIIVVTYTLEKASFKNLLKAKKFIDSFVVHRPNSQVYCITSSNDEQIHKISDSLNVPSWTFCKIDEVTSKTIIRSNPGVVLLREGVILDKIHYHKLNRHKLNSLLGVR